MRGFSVSSVCRSIGHAGLAGGVQADAHRAVGVRVQVRAAARHVRALPERRRRSLPACPASGCDTSATTCTSTRPRQRSRTSISAASARMPIGPPTFTCVRTLVVPSARWMRIACSARVTMSSCVRVPAMSCIASMAPSRSPGGIRRARRGQRLVQVRVRLDERRHEHLAGQVLVARQARSRGRDDLRDQAAGEFDVDQFSRRAVRADRSQLTDGHRRDVRPAADLRPAPRRAPGGRPRPSPASTASSFPGSAAPDRFTPSTPGISSTVCASRTAAATPASAGSGALMIASR